MQRTYLLATFALGLAAAPIACLHGTERLVQSGVEGGVAGGLKGLSDPQNREMLVRLLKDADIQQAAHDLTAALTGGAVDGLTDDERMAHVRAASDAYIRTISAAVGEAVGEDISPAVTRGVKDVVGGAVAAALRPANRELAQDLVDGVTRSAITAFTQSTAQGLRDDLGPAMSKVLAEDLGPALQQVVETNLGPALRKVLDEDLRPAILAAIGGEEGDETGTLARAFTKQIVLGVNDGMSELGISPSPNGKDGIGLAGWGLIVLAVLLLAVSGLLVRMYFTRRALARDRARSEEMLVNILRAVKSSETGATDESSNLAAVIARVHQQNPDLGGDNSYFATIVDRVHRPAGNSAPVAVPPRVAGRGPNRPRVSRILRRGETRPSRGPERDRDLQRSNRRKARSTS